MMTTELYNIVRELKGLRMMYSDDLKEFWVQTVERKEGEFPTVIGEIKFGKVYAFSIARFLIRIFQKEFRRAKYARRAR